MRSLLISWCLAGVLLLGSTAGMAVPVTNLYRAEVPVANQGRAALDDAARDALGEVLVKVSGSAEVLDLAAIRQAMARAKDMVQQYNYRRESGELRVLIEFPSELVTELVTSAGAPLWTANRPATLAWVAVDLADGRRFLTPAAELYPALEQAFDQRGLPLRFPLYDLQDSTALKVDDLWRLNGAALTGATARYGNQHILAGRMSQLSTGRWLGDWSYISDEGRVDRRVEADDAAALAVTGSTLVAEALAARYAVATTATMGGSVLMRVQGITDFRQYRELVSWLESLELVKHANVELMQGDTLTLRLVAQAAAAQLRSTIELNRRLEVLPYQDPDIELVYRWLN
jgi:hypothetical protein